MWEKYIVVLMKFDLLSLLKNKPNHKITKMEFLVLVCLKRRPLHGYGIMKRLSEKMPGVWEPKSGSLYPLLSRMVRKNFLSTKIVKGQKKYALTDEGKIALNEYLLAWKQLYDLFKKMNKV